MHTDLDSLAAALYVKSDDLLKDSPQLAPWRPASGIAPRLSDAELITLGSAPPISVLPRVARTARSPADHPQVRVERTGRCQVLR